MILNELFTNNIKAAIDAFNERSKSINVDEKEDGAEIMKITFNELCDEFKLSHDEQLTFADYITKNYNIDVLMEDEALLTAFEIMEELKCNSTEAINLAHELLVFEGKSTKSLENDWCLIKDVLEETMSPMDRLKKWDKGRLGSPIFTKPKTTQDIADLLSKEGGFDIDEITDNSLSGTITVSKVYGLPSYMEPKEAIRTWLVNNSLNHFYPNVVVKLADDLLNVEFNKRNI